MKRIVTLLSAVALAALPVSALESGSIGEYTLDPPPGDVPALSTIKIDFPSTGAFGIDFPVAEKINAITLTSESASYYAVKSDYSGASHVVLHFALQGSNEEADVLPTGTYTLNVPAQTFYEFYSTTKFNDVITAVYTVTGGSGEPEGPDVFANPAADPVPDKAYGSLERVSITFPDLKNGLTWPLSDLGRITLKKEGDPTVYIANTPTLSGADYNTVSFGFNKPDNTMSETLVFKEAGTYTVTLEAGALSEYQHADSTSPAMSFTYFVDPTLNFTYQLSPDPDKCYENLSELSVSAGDGQTMKIADSTQYATLSCQGTTLALDASEADGSVLFKPRMVSSLLPGDWTLSIPAGLLACIPAGGDYEMPNREPVTAVYKVREPMTFGYTVSPASGSEVEMLNTVTVAFEGEGLRQVGFDNGAGRVLLDGEAIAESVEMYATTSGFSIDLKCNADLPDGQYTVSVPAGFLITTDSNGLQSEVPAFKLTYTVAAPELPDFAEGIIVLNEGWFGHDTGSINFFPTDGVPYYNAFTAINPTSSLGTTTESGQVFGNRVYVVSKMAPYLVGLDATTFKEAGSLSEINADANPQAHSFCAVNDHKGYLSTSDGLYIVDLDTYTVSRQVTAEGMVSHKFGQMVRYGNRVFVVSHLDGIVAIDIATDEAQCIDLPTAAALTVSADGSLYAATLNEDSEIVKIDPYTFELKNINIEADKAKIQSPWSTWRESAFAADRDREVIYFVPAGWNPRTVARYDLATGEYTADFFTLPGKADGLTENRMLYGQGISVDPATGYITVLASEDGYGTHYQHNWLYFYDPATGRPVEDKTVALRDYYWFPAMALYPSFVAPELRLDAVTIHKGDADTTIDLAAATTLKAGNPHLVVYTACSSDTDVFSVSLSPAGQLTLTPGNSGKATLSVTASYQGRENTFEAEVTVDDPDSILSTEVAPATFDIYTTTGILVKRNATESDIQALPAGIYIAGERKVVVR